MILSIDDCKRFCILIFFTLLILFIACSGKTVYAHSLGQSYIFIKRHDSQSSGHFEITLSDLNKDLKTISTRGPITEANLKDRIDEVYNYYIEKVQFYDGTRKLPIVSTGSGMRQSRIAKYALLDFNFAEISAGPDVIDIEYAVMFDTDPDHLALLVIEQFLKAGIFSNENHVLLTFSPENRGDALRTVIEVIDGVPRQRVVPRLPYSMGFIDLSATPEAERVYRSRLEQRKVRRLDLSACSFDSVLIKLTPERFKWYFNQHHILKDALSAVLIHRQMVHFYQLACERSLQEAPGLNPYQAYVEYECQFRQTDPYRQTQTYCRLKNDRPFNRLIKKGP